MEKYLYLLLTVCSAAGFGYGLYRFFREKSALYIRMIVFGIGSTMFGRLFALLQILSNGEIQQGFHVGMLGVLGSFIFFFSANYGTIDSLVDDRTPKFRKYRWIAILAPLATVAMFVLYFLKVGFCWDALIHFVEMTAIGCISYFHLKHLIIPDVQFGVVRSLRMYNLQALIYAFLCMLEMLFDAYAVPTFCTVILYILMSVILLIFVPILEKGVKSWSI